MDRQFKITLPTLVQEEELSFSFLWWRSKSLPIWLLLHNKCEEEEWCSGLCNDTVIALLHRNYGTVDGPYRQNVKMMVFQK